MILSIRYILAIFLALMAFFIFVISNKQIWGFITGLLLLFSGMSIAVYEIIYQNRYCGEHYTYLSYLSPQSERSFSSPEGFYRNDYYIGM
jgi:hypothetical protein